MIDVNQLRKSTTFVRDGELYRVTDYKHIKSGRGGATIRVTVRNLRSGSITEMTFPSGNTVEDVVVEKIPVQYLYDDGQFLHFMDTVSYEQPALPKSMFGTDALHLQENMALALNSFDGEILDYELPVVAEYEVIETEMAVTGDRAQNPSKKVKLNGGFELSVPMFINVGDIIRINLEEGTYLTRVNR
jgi:elongation factor P